jgi:hypothetical protein
VKREIDVKCGFNVSPDSCGKKYKVDEIQPFFFRNLAAINLLSLYSEEVKCFGDPNRENTIEISLLKIQKTFIERVKCKG